MRRRPYPLADKVVVITGGGGGIGSAFARRVAARGGRCVLVDLRADATRAVAASLPGGSHLPGGEGRHGVREADLTVRAEVEALMSDLADSYGRIDVAVNNMGMTSAERFDERSVESIERELIVNLHAPLVFTRLAIPLLRRAADPRVISTVSLGGILPLGETDLHLVEVRAARRDAVDRARSAGQGHRGRIGPAVGHRHPDAAPGGDRRRQLAAVPRPAADRRAGGHHDGITARQAPPGGLS